MTRALQTTPFKNPGGVPWPWRTDVQRTEGQKFLCLILDANVSRIFLYKDEWSASIGVTGVVKFPGGEHLFLYWVYDVLQCCIFLDCSKEKSVFIACAKKCCEWFVKNCVTFVNSLSWSKFYFSGSQVSVKQKTSQMKIMILMY